jgi:hypothetical protein
VPVKEGNNITRHYQMTLSKKKYYLAVGVRAILTHVSKHFVGRHHGSHLDVK